MNNLGAQGSICIFSDRWDVSVSLFPGRRERERERELISVKKGRDKRKVDGWMDGWMLKKVDSFRWEDELDLEIGEKMRNRERRGIEIRLSEKRSLMQWLEFSKLHLIGHTIEI